MKSRLVTRSFLVVLCFAVSLSAQEIAQEKAKKVDPPAELKLIKSSIGVWDAEIEVWPNGLDNDSMTMKGIETVKAFGQYWAVSDFTVEFQGNEMVVHSVVGYDLDEKKLVGLIVDHGPYKAKMTGEYDKDKKTVKWTVHAKNLDGSKMVQVTEATHKSDTERHLVMYMREGDDQKLQKKMTITYTKREE